MSLDPVSNFGLAQISGTLALSATSVFLKTGEVSNLPTSGSFNCVLWNQTDYSSPIEDPFKEIVRVNAISGNTLNVSRAQEGTADTSHAIAGKQYVLANTITKKMIEDIGNELASIVAADGDVNGPSSSTNNYVAVYSGTSGKAIKQSEFQMSGGSLYNSNYIAIQGASGAAVVAFVGGVSLVSASGIDLYTPSGNVIKTYSSLVPFSGNTGSIGTSLFPYASGSFVSLSGTVVQGPLITGATISGNTLKTKDLTLDGGTVTALSSFIVSASSGIGLGAGTFLELQGSGVTIATFSNGDINLNASVSGVVKTDSNIVPTASGTKFIGTASIPFSGVYAKSINNKIITVGKYNEVPSGLINSSNTVYTLNFAPYNQSLQLYKNGSYMIPSGIGSVTFDYVLLSTTVTMASAPVSGNSLVCNYQYQA